MRILLVEDNPGDARLTKELLKEVSAEQIEVEHAKRLSEATDILSLSNADAVLLDLGLPDSNGIDTFVKLHDSAPQTPIVVLSGTKDEDIAVKTVHLGAQDYLIKDEINSSLLYRVVRYAIERQRLEYQLRKKHDEMQLILDSMPAYVFYKDKDGKMLNINKAAMGLAYAPKEKLLQKTVFDLMPETADKYNRDDMDVIRSGQPKMNIEESLELPSGLKWLKTDKLPIRDDDGNVVGLLGFSVDITDRKRAEDELQESEAKYRFLTEEMNAVIWTTDMNFNSTYVSPSITGTLGYTTLGTLISLGTRLSSGT